MVCPPVAVPSSRLFCQYSPPRHKRASGPGLKQERHRPDLDARSPSADAVQGSSLLPANRSLPPWGPFSLNEGPVTGGGSGETVRGLDGEQVRLHLGNAASRMGGGLPVVPLN